MDAQILQDVFLPYKHHPQPFVQPAILLIFILMQQMESPVVQLSDKTHVVNQEDALTGRTTPMPVATTHAVNGHSMTYVPDNMEVALFAMGCFWGVERLFWQLEGVHSTAAGYSGGFTPNPTYREVCTGHTGPYGRTGLDIGYLDWRYIQNMCSCANGIVKGQWLVEGSDLRLTERLANSRGAAPGGVTQKQGVVTYGIGIITAPLEAAYEAAGLKMQK